MRVSTNQSPSFADDFVTTPDSDLDILDKIVQWDNLQHVLRVTKSDYQALSMFKILLLQRWHNLSDAVISSALRRDLVFMKFCGFSLDGKKPDAGTICRFRSQLVEKNLLPKLMSIVNQSLEQQNLKLSDGKYVTADATLIQSQRRPRKVYSTHQQDEVYEVDEKEYSADKEASWLKKGEKVVYGFNSTVITDENGLVESVSTNSANVSEMKSFADSISSANLPKGKTVLYDKGAASKRNSKYLKEQKLGDGIMRKKPMGKKMSYWNKVRNRLISSKRFVVERTFGTMKGFYGMSRARYLGTAKVNGQVLVSSIAYNLRRAINLYKQQQYSCV